jgi:hypothetical protein
VIWCCISSPTSDLRWLPPSSHRAAVGVPSDLCRHRWFPLRSSLLVSGAVFVVRDRLAPHHRSPASSQNLATSTTRTLHGSPALLRPGSPLLGRSRHRFWFRFVGVARSVVLSRLCFFIDSAHFLPDQLGLASPQPASFSWWLNFV